MTNKESLMGIWVFCEQTAGQVRPVAYELLHEAARLARDMNSCVTAILPGSADDQARELIYRGADQVIRIVDESLHDMSELRCADELTALIRKYDPAVLLLGATAFGRSMAPRVAARLGTGLTADCTSLDIDPDTGLLLQTRPAFGGNLMATITCPNTRPQMATVRPKVFTAAVADESRTGEIFHETPAAREDALRVIEKIAAAGEINIGDADVLVSVGQGIGGEENIALAQKLAQKLGGTLSASRPLVDAGIVPYARQVGQTGKTVAPRLYIACGISGAIQHMAGVAAENIVAVNTDPDAPIFQHAKWGIVGDCGDFLRDMLEALEN